MTLDGVTSDSSADQTISPELVLGKLADILIGKVALEVNRKLNAGEDVEAVLNFVYDSLGLIIPYDRIGVCLEEGGQLILTWMSRKYVGKHLRVGYSIPIKNTGLKKMFETGMPRIINDLPAYAQDHQDSESLRLSVEEGIRSSLSCPLITEGRLIGMVIFASCKLNTYNAAHIETFLEISEQVSAIVAIGRLRELHRGNGKSSTISMILHDLRAPLGIIQGNLELLLEEDWFQGLDCDDKRVFSTLLRNTLYMEDLIKQLADVEQIRQHKFSIDMEEVTLADFIREMAENGQALAKKKEIKFALQIESALPEKAAFDPLRMHQVLENLFSNAVKFSDRHSTITFSVRSEGNRLLFSVADQGIGIPESELPKLFREFGKTCVVPTEGEASTGLGLSIAKRIVDLHCGQMSVSSKVAQGSTFSFWIPTSREAVTH
ncbi:MAG TPA: GAF domain-containing sensor histidine kinase [Bdellovibrionales bacterium]|nr:GAF domain-containing sensor histidine kinase [Bdellovibrionales bacterium]